MLHPREIFLATCLAIIFVATQVAQCQTSCLTGDILGNIVGDQHLGGLAQLAGGTKFHDSSCREKKNKNSESMIHSAVFNAT